MLFKKTILAAVSAVALPSGAAEADETDSYAQGHADWQTYKPWFDAQTGDRAAGAKYWAANRNVPGHMSCDEASSEYKTFGDKLTFTVGCQEAKRRLDPIDARRNSDPEYRLGFADAAKGLSPQANAPVTSAPASPPVTSVSASPPVISTASWQATPLPASKAAPTVAAKPQDVPALSPAADLGTVRSGTGPTEIPTGRITPAGEKVATVVNTPVKAVPAPAADSEKSTEKPRIPTAQLPDQTPRGIPVEKKSFYLVYSMGLVDDPAALLRLADAAIDLARMNGLRCDSVTGLRSWTFSKGWTLQCNQFNYKYDIQDKGRGWQISPAT